MSYNKMNDENFLGEKLRVALVHDWLVSYRGGEKVLESIGKLFPNAPIFTLFYDPNELPDAIRNKQIFYPRFLNKFQKIRKILLPFLPSAIEAIDLKGYDLIISTSSCVAKGIIPPIQSKHVCYIHSPMRYIWDQRGEYFRSLDGVPILPGILNFFLSQLRTWDAISSNRVDTFIANSNFVKQRVTKYYRRDSTVIHPPVYLDHFYKVGATEKEPYFLVAGALVPYKRFDLAIQACNALGYRLIVAGTGSSENYLRSLGGDKTQFVIAPSDEKLAELMRKAQALIFPGVEDFGIVSIEAMASGTPVIALSQGGAMDFVEPMVNGCFFKEQSVECLVDALRTFKLEDFDLNQIVQSTQRFSEERFLSEMRNELRRSIGV